MVSIVNLFAEKNWGDILIPTEEEYPSDIP